MAAGRAASYIIGYAYDVDSVEEMSLKTANPYETVAIPIAKQMMSPITLTWGIAQTCKNPEAAAKVLNMLYTDETVLNDKDALSYLYLAYHDQMKKDVNKYITGYNEAVTTKAKEDE